MDISLVMVVKNEELGITKCLDAIKTCCTEIIIVDTGSIDGTKDVLRNQHGIIAIDFDIQREDRFKIVPARNFGISMATCPWIMTLDADEVAHTETCHAILNLRDDPKVHGYFGVWINKRKGVAFDDYKLFLFRNSSNISFLGNVHSVPQTSIRLNAQYATRLNGLIFHHEQVEGKLHRSCYSDQMIQGILESPKWFRYHWFLGYTYLQKGDLGNAITFLEQAAYSRSTFFPVEVINSIIVLCSIYKKIGSKNYMEMLSLFDAFYPVVSGDFEVVINNYNTWRHMADRKTGERLFAY